MIDEPTAQPRPLQGRPPWPKILLVGAAAAILATAGCVEGYQAPSPPQDGLFYPIGLEMHPDGRFLYVTNSNFPLQFRDDLGGTVMVIDTTTDEIWSEQTIQVPSFTSQIALNADASRMYVPSRHDNELTVLSVADNGQALWCDDGGRRLADVRPCTTRRVPNQRDGTRISNDPFGLAVGQVERQIGGETRQFDVVHFSYLRGNDVSAISLPDAELSGATMQTASLVTGGGNLVVRRPGTNDVFVAGRNANRIDGFWPYINNDGELEVLVRGPSIRILERGTNMDARGLTFDDSGNRMYVATRRPNALHVVNFNRSGGPAVASTIALERKPSGAHFHRGADGVDRIYVPSYRYGIIEVVEPATGAVVDEIDVGRSPYEMAFDPRPVHCAAPGQRCRAYVTLFDAGDDGRSRCDEGAEQCGQLAIIDLDPASPTFHTVTGRIQ